MFDIKWIRQNPDEFDAMLSRRAHPPMSAEILCHDEMRREHVQKLQEAQTRRNTVSKQVGKLKASGENDKAATLIAEIAEIKSFVQNGEVEERRLTDALETVLAAIPNLPFADVPEGRDESDNVEHHKFGTLPKFDFEPKQHFELGESLGLMDFETAAMISGSRFVVLKGHWRGWNAHFPNSCSTCTHRKMDMRKYRRQFWYAMKQCLGPGNCQNLPKICFAPKMGAG